MRKEDLHVRQLVWYKVSNSNGMEKTIPCFIDVIASGEGMRKNQRNKLTRVIPTSRHSERIDGPFSPVVLQQEGNWVDVNDLTDVPPFIPIKLDNKHDKSAGIIYMPKLTAIEKVLKRGDKVVRSTDRRFIIYTEISYNKSDKCIEAFEIDNGFKTPYTGNLFNLMAMPHPDDNKVWFYCN